MKKHLWSMLPIGASLLVLAAVALAQVGSNNPNPLGPLPKAFTGNNTGMNFGPPFYADLTGPQAAYRSSGNLPVVFAGHMSIASGVAGQAPSYISGGGGNATFDSLAIDSRFRVTTGGGASTSVVVGFANTPSTWTVAPGCQVEPEQGTTTNVFAVPTATQLTISWTGSVASAVFDVQCTGAQVR